MCGIVGLHLRDPELYPRLGELLTGMLCEMGDRGSDSAGVAVYGDPIWSPPGRAASRCSRWCRRPRKSSALSVSVTRHAATYLRYGRRTFAAELLDAVKAAYPDAP